jgi:hypothetical protein
MDVELNEFLDFHRACPEWDHNWLLLSPQSSVTRSSNGIDVATHLSLQRGELAVDLIV